MQTFRVTHFKPKFVSLPFVYGGTCFNVTLHHDWNREKTEYRSHCTNIISKHAWNCYCIGNSSNNDQKKRFPNLEILEWSFLWLETRHSINKMYNHNIQKHKIHRYFPWNFWTSYVHGKWKWKTNLIWCM